MPLTNLPDLELIRPGRVHEAVGPGRRAFAAVLAGRLAGPVLWVQEGRERDRLCPQGLAAFFDPARLLLARPAGALAVLQVTEEALRSGAVALVVAELTEAPDLTASRRLQLAAGTGGGRGLCLVPQSRTRANAAETRWHCTPLPGGGLSGGAQPGYSQSGPHQFWELVKNKRGRLGTWEVGWEAAPRASLRETPPPPGPALAPTLAPPLAPNPTPARREPRLAAASP